MALRKVLQEIAVLPPQTEEQSFVVLTEEAMPDLCDQLLSLPARAHAKYISNDEAKENITPSEFDTITKEKYKCEKSELGKPADVPEPKDLGDQERSASGSRSSLQHKDEVTPGMTAGAQSIFTPTKESDCSDWRIGESNTPMDFAKATVHDFGISSDSFTNCVGKSPRSVHKHRRRSTIGVRGSPEMNFLIRQIALQRSNRKMDPEPLHLQSNTFTTPRNSVLKEKMSSFRNAFQAVEENEGKLPFPGFSEEEEIQGSKVYGNTHIKAEPPMKRKRVCDPSLPEIHSVPLLSTQPPKTTQEIEQVPGMEKISESDNSSTSRLFSVVPKSVNMQSEEIKPVPSSTRGRKRKVMFAEISSPPKSKRTLCRNDTHKSDGHTSSSPVIRPVLKKTSRTEFSLRDEPEDQSVCFLLPEPSENENNTLFKKTVNDSVKKKKRVTFGRDLSPELFDKTLPANTPLRKGSTPYRQHVSQDREQEIAQSPCQSLPQPDFDCRDEEDTFKPLSLCFDTESPSQDSTMLLSSPGNVAPFWPTEELEDVIQKNNHKEEDETLLISNDFLENTTTAAPALDTEIANESFIASEPDTVPTNSRVTRYCDKSKACSSEDPSTCDHPQTADAGKVAKSATAKPTKRGRKPVFIKRVQVKVSQGKRSRGRPKKSVEKSLYGARETVSKKPLLSPIPELPDCYPIPPASTLVSTGVTFNKERVKRIAKRKGICGDNKNIHKNNAPSNVVEFFSDPVITKIEDVTEDSGCPGKAGLEFEHTKSLTDSDRHTEPGDLVVQIDAFRQSAECLLASADKEMKQDEECKPEPSESVPEDKGTIETITSLKPPNKSKRRSTKRKRASQTTTEVPHIITETPTDLVENLMKAEHNTIATVTEGPQPKKSLLVDDKAQLPEVAVTSRRRGRPLKNYHTPALFCPSTEPNTNSQDLCTMLPHPDESSSTFINEPCLPIDEILQPTGTEKKVRRSLRLRRDSGASGLFWVQENTSSERTSRQKSLSSALQSLESSKVILESVTCSPNKEQPNVQQVSSAAKKSRRRTLCTSTLQQTTSACDTKRRRSNVSYKDPYVPSAESQTCRYSITLDA